MFNFLHIGLFFYIRNRKLQIKLQLDEGLLKAHLPLMGLTSGKTKTE